MRILLIKMSSLGDVIHTLPAISDLKKQRPDVQLDWVVEESFAEIARWHPGVTNVLPVALRRWRKNPAKARRSSEWQAFRKSLEEARYDLVIDAQGLLKSAWVAKLAQAPVVGYDGLSIREPLASRFYARRYAVSRRQHAVERIRKLFAMAMGYSEATLPLDYGCTVAPVDDAADYLVFLHGTTWQTKHWPEQNWRELALKATGQGLEVRLLWGNDVEKTRAERLADIPGVRVMPRMGLMQVASLLKGAKAVVSVDTGLGHLAAALDCSIVALYGPTDPYLTGIYGVNQVSLCGDYHCAPCMKRHCRYEVIASDLSTFSAPCWQSLTVSRVWSRLQTLSGSR